MLLSPFLPYTTSNWKIICNHNIICQTTALIILTCIKFINRLEIKYIIHISTIIALIISLIPFLPPLLFTEPYIISTKQIRSWLGVHENKGKEFLMPWFLALGLNIIHSQHALVLYKLPSVWVVSQPFLNVEARKKPRKQLKPVSWRDWSGRWLLFGYWRGCEK